MARSVKRRLGASVRFSSSMTSFAYWRSRLTSPGDARKIRISRSFAPAAVEARLLVGVGFDTLLARGDIRAPAPLARYRHEAYIALARLLLFHDLGHGLIPAISAD